MATRHLDDHSVRIVRTVLVSTYCRLAVRGVVEPRREGYDGAPNRAGTAGRDLGVLPRHQKDRLPRSRFTATLCRRLRQELANSVAVQPRAGQPRRHADPRQRVRRCPAWLSGMDRRSCPRRPRLDADPDEATPLGRGVPRAPPARRRRAPQCCSPAWARATRSPHATLVWRSGPRPHSWCRGAAVAAAPRHHSGGGVVPSCPRGERDRDTPSPATTLVSGCTRGWVYR